MFRQLRLCGRLAVKDWKLFLADRRAAILCFAVPIVLASAFGMIFNRPGQRLGECRLTLLMVVPEESPFTRGVIEALRSSEHVDVRLVDRTTADAEVERRNGVAVYFPPGMTSLQRGEKPVFELHHHPLASLESQWAEGVLTEAVMRHSARSYLAPLGVDAAHLDRPFSVRKMSSNAETRQPFNSYSHSFSGMMLQYLLFWGMECGLLLLRERQRGIWQRVRAAPVPLTTALLGRALSTAVIALLQVGTTFLFGWIVFGVTIEGSWAGFLLLAVAISVLAAGVGLLVAALGSTEARARSLFIVVILAVSMLGGLWLPAFLLPRWVQEWSLALPTAWAMRGLDGVTWQGAGFTTIGSSLLMVFAFAIVFLVLSIARFHQSEARRRRGVYTC